MKFHSNIPGCTRCSESPPAALHTHHIPASLGFVSVAPGAASRRQSSPGPCRQWSRVVPRKKSQYSPFGIFQIIGSDKSLAQKAFEQCRCQALSFTPLGGRRDSQQLQSIGPGYKAMMQPCGELSNFRVQMHSAGFRFSSQSYRPLLAWTWRMSGS